MTFCCKNVLTLLAITLLVNKFYACFLLSEAGPYHHCQFAVEDILPIRQVNVYVFCFGVAFPPAFLLPNVSSVFSIEIQFLLWLFNPQIRMLLQIVKTCSTFMAHILFSVLVMSEVHH